MALVLGLFWFEISDYQEPVMTKKKTQTTADQSPFILSIDGSHVTRTYDKIYRLT